MQILDDIRTEVEDRMTQFGTNYNQRKYVKITETLKNKLTDLVINSRFTIKEASKMVNINYTSGKLLMKEYKQMQQYKEARKKLRMAKVTERQPYAIPNNFLIKSICKNKLVSCYLLSDIQTKE